MQPVLSNNFTLAIIGGGRWGQVTLSVLLKMNLPLQHVIMSEANYHGIANQLNSLTNQIGTFNVVSSIPELITHYNVNGAIVVNSAGQHFETANALIKKGIHVLIEKPIVLSSKEMKLLIENSITHNVVMVPGLSYRFCSYIHNFAVHLKNEIAKSFTFIWHDTHNEVRYGQRKRHDLTIDILQDVMPHIWTILSIIFKCSITQIDFCESTNCYENATLLIKMDNIKGKVVLRRNAPERKRYLSVECITKKSIAIDFTTEPGKITTGTERLSGDIDWDKKNTPLTLQLHHFFSMINSGYSCKKDIEDCLESVRCTELASTLLSPKEAVYNK